MPMTYPAPREQAKPAKMPKAFSGVITGAGHSSVYLTPLLQERILSWREATDEPSTKPVIKSAPASLHLSTGTKSSGVKSGRGGNGTVCTCTCTCGGMGTDCPTCGSPPTVSECSVHSPRSKSLPRSRKSNKGPNANVKGYYSSKRTAPSSSNMTPTLPAMMTVRPKTPPPGRRPPVINMVKENNDWGGRARISSPGQLEAAPPEQARPPPLPHIAGVRDPISTNYWRQMFPPEAGGILMSRGGIYPPQTFGAAFGF